MWSNSRATSDWEIVEDKVPGGTSTVEYWVRTRATRSETRGGRNQCLDSVRRFEGSEAEGRGMTTVAVCLLADRG